jgi:hypothetical protein
MLSHPSDPELNRLSERVKAHSSSMRRKDTGFYVQSCYSQNVLSLPLLSSSEKTVKNNDYTYTADLLLFL